MNFLFSTLIDIWESLASGAPIDDQRVEREARARPAPPAAVNGNVVKSEVKEDEDSDDERDPNDAPAAPNPPNFSSDPYLDADDSDDDY